MKYSREGLLLPAREVNSVDSEIFESFSAVHLNTVATYEQMSLVGDRKQQAANDLRAGKDVDFTVHNIDRLDLEEQITSLKRWKVELIADDSIDEDVKQIYRWRVNEDIANKYMLRASIDGNMNAYRRWNEYVYGKPNEHIYQAALDWVANDADTIITTSQKPETVAAAEKVQAMLADKRGYRELLAPDPIIFEAVRDDHMKEQGYYALLLAGVEIPEGKVNTETGDPILRHVLLNNLQSTYDISDASAGTWSVSHSDSSVKRPKKYDIASERFIGLGLGHEIGSHLLEKVNGQRGPLALAANGLDRYESGNEGRATIREQVPYETFDEFGKLVRWRDILRRHIAVSYAEGVGEDAPHTSQELYQFMYTIDMMYQSKLKTPLDGQSHEDKAHSKTAALVTRILRGVNGSKGGAYLKDKVYLEGHVACWATAAERGPTAISDGDLGKFDINNSRHIFLLQNYGLLPDNR